MFRAEIDPLPWLDAVNRVENAVFKTRRSNYRLIQRLQPLDDLAVIGNRTKYDSVAVEFLYEFDGFEFVRLVFVRVIENDDVFFPKRNALQHVVKLCVIGVFDIGNDEHDLHGAVCLQSARISVRHKMKFIDRRLNPLRLFAAYGSLLIDKARNGCNGYPRFPRDIVHRNHLFCLVNVYIHV